MTYDNIKYRKLKALMVEKGKTQHDLSKLLGISIGAVNRKINGKIPWKLSECAKISAAFGLTIEEIFSPYYEKEAAVSR